MTSKTQNASPAADLSRGAIMGHGEGDRPGALHRGPERMKVGTDPDHGMYLSDRERLYEGLALMEGPQWAERLKAAVECYVDVADVGDAFAVAAGADDNMPWMYAGAYIAVYGTVQALRIYKPGLNFFDYIEGVFRERFPTLRAALAPATADTDASLYRFWGRNRLHQYRLRRAINPDGSLYSDVEVLLVREHLTPQYALVANRSGFRIV